MKVLGRRFWMFKLLQWNTENTIKSRKENNCPSEVFTNYRIYRGSHQEILEYHFWKIQQNPWKTYVVVHFN